MPNNYSTMDFDGPVRVPKRTIGINTDGFDDPEPIRNEGGDMLFSRRASKEFHAAVIENLKASSLRPLERIRIRRALIWHGAEIEDEVLAANRIANGVGAAIDWQNLDIDWEKFFEFLLKFITLLIGIGG